MVGAKTTTPSSFEFGFMKQHPPTEETPTDKLYLFLFFQQLCYKNLFFLIYCRKISLLLPLWTFSLAGRILGKQGSSFAVIKEKSLAVKRLLVNFRVHPLQYRFLVLRFKKPHSLCFLNFSGANQYGSREVSVSGRYRSVAKQPHVYTTLRQTFGAIERYWHLRNRHACLYRIICVMLISHGCYTRITRAFQNDSVLQVDHLS